MIKNAEHRYIFIGLPMTGSSAIHKVLLEKYEGESIFYKHSHILSLILRPKLLLKYKIICVYRDPLQKVVSRYAKIGYSYNGRKDSGNWINKFKKVDEDVYKGLSFEGYVKRRFSIWPYHDWFWLNNIVSSYVFNFNTLNADFKLVFDFIYPDRVNSLEHINRTKDDFKPKVVLDEEEWYKYFGPYFLLIKKFRPDGFDSSRVPVMSKLMFLFSLVPRFMLGVLVEFFRKDKPGY